MLCRAHNACIYLCESVMIFIRSVCEILLDTNLDDFYCYVWSNKCL